MAAFFSQSILMSLLLACLVSFGWAMRSFFLRPAGETKGMRLTGTSGVVCALLHIAAIVMTGPIPAARATAAAALYSAALGLFWWAISVNRAQPLSAIFSPDLPEHIMNRGPYRYIRHPLYCSYLLTWMAGTVGTWLWWLIPTVLFMAAIYIQAARAEEAKFLRSSLAQPYREYRARTGLFIPLPWKLFAAGRSRSSR